ncbi:protein FAM13A isoform X2 [Archocentrus centrarchus]|uniref:protein FAM13A isoform X2 n=1 Tax=Archocentrus centrarchus TaxID=63155 RepID=UPI0011EA26EB|nr:protein FAM13A isoform X2 [Archocentrus centrarchus]
MGAGAMTICHNKAAVQVREDMKKMVQMPILRPRAVAAKDTKLFGVTLFELREQGLVEDGVPLVVRRMVEYLRKDALHREGLFRVNGNVRAVETLKQRLERGEDVDLLSESDSLTIASLLKQYLRDLPGGLVDLTVQQALIQHYQEYGDDCTSDVRHLLLQLPDIHHSLLRYLCHFLTLVESNHKDNRMTALNLATVFGPSVFHVAPGFEALKDQNICNKIMAKLIQNYSNIFEVNTDKEDCTKEESSLITAKDTHVTQADTKNPSSHLDAKTLTPLPRMKCSQTGRLNQPGNAELQKKSCTNAPKAKTRKKKVRKGKSDGMTQVVQPSLSSGVPHHPRPFSIPIVLPLTSELRSPSAEAMETIPVSCQDTSDTASHVDPRDISPFDSMEGLSSSQDGGRPISPFYMSNHLSPVHCRPDVVNFLDRTISSAVEQHLFDVNPLEAQQSDSCELTTCSSRVTPTARQRRRAQREQQQEEGQKHREKNRGLSVREDTNKENVPSSSGSTSASVGEDMGSRVESQAGQSSHAERTPKPRKPKNNPTFMQLTENKAAQATLKMKIQESPVTCDMGRVGGEVRGPDSDCEKTNCEDVPRLDLTALTEDNNWGDSPFCNTPFLDFKSFFHLSCCDEPVPAYSLQRESMDREEARLSPHGGGRVIRQLLEEASDPMVSPRFYAYGQSQQYLDDTEVPPSPPNAHSFISRRRSSSLGSCDDEREELTSAQLTKRIHVLKKKIHRFEEKFEEERKYRPSHSDKAANPEVLRWMNELARLRKELKEHKLMKSEEDLPPLTRQRSNTLPKSFGSQLEKKPQQEKVSKPPVESTLEGILKKLQEKRDEVNRPEDIKDMTREQIAAEKVALQKALLYYESIHGRPMTKSERQVMKPLYDRYRLVKQILCRASTIPVIGSPSSKRRGPLLQPIIEGETALFFDDIKEEEDGSEDDGDSKTQFTVTVRPDINVFSFLEHVDDEVDGFISPVDELSPSKNTTDTRLSNLHSATMQELVEQLQEAREEKKRIRKNLKEFEDQFFRQNGRNVQKEDRSPLAVEYNEYKHVKAKLRLLEVLISKRDPTKFI